MSEISTTQRAKGQGFNLGRLLLEGRAFFALIATVAVFSALSPHYLTVSNRLIIASHVASYGILAIGMLLVILNGGIDLSVGSVLALSGVIAGALMQGTEIPPLGVILFLPVWAVVVATCCAGAMVGAVNGVLMAWFKVPAFVATLGVMYVARGVALLQTSGLTYNNLSGRADLGNTGFDWPGFDWLAGVPISVLVLATIAVVTALMLMRSAFGRWLYASGGNERAADLSGVPVNRVKITVCMLSGDAGRRGRAGAVVATDLCRADCRHHL